MKNLMLTLNMMDLERIIDIQDTKSYWHKTLCPRGKCIICDIRRALRGKAFMCPHFGHPVRGYGLCRKCYFAYLRQIPEQRERMNAASRKWMQEHRDEVNRAERERFYTDAEYRERKRARDNESQTRRYHRNPDLRDAQYCRKYQARQRKKTERQAQPCSA